MVARIGLSSSVTVLSCVFVAYAADLDIELQRAIRRGGKGRVENVKKLVAKGAGVNSVFDESNTGLGIVEHFYYTPLYYASSRGDVQLTKALLDLGANVNIGGSSGSSGVGTYSPQTLEIVTMLVERGADVDAQSRKGMVAEDLSERSLVFFGGKEGRQESKPQTVLRFEALTPLAAASLGGHPEIVKLLLDHGANPNLSGAAGQTPLLLALARAVPADNRNPEGFPIEFLKKGATPLILAVSMNRPELVQYLISRRANPSLENAAGVSAIGLARRNKLDGILEVLEGPRASEKATTAPSMEQVKATGHNPDISGMRILAEKHCMNPTDAFAARMLVAKAIAEGHQYRDPSVRVRVILQEQDGKPRLVLHPALRGNPAAAAAWMAYGGTIIKQREANQRSIGLASETFAEIVEGLEAAIEFWKDAKQKRPALQDQELDDLLALKQQGHLASAVYFGRYSALPVAGFGSWYAGHKDELLRYVNEVLLVRLN